MAAQNFLILLLIAGFIVILLKRHMAQKVPGLSNFYDLSRPRPFMTTVSDKEEPVPPALQPFQLPPLKLRTSSRMSMGLKRLEESNWLTIDTFYHTEHTLRAHMLNCSRPNVLQCLPGTETACQEVLDLVTSFLSRRFPEHFTINHSTSVIFNHLAKESLPIGTLCPNPLEAAARLAMEDFNILMKDPDTGEYRLMASATLFPAGWQLQERIGTSMANLHSPVPGWQSKLGAAVNRYFDHLSPRTCMERYNLFIQTTTELFQDEPEAPSASASTLRPEDITVRRERQTFTRLEKSGAVLFTVRTYMQPLTDLAGEEVAGLLSQIRGWEGEMGTYKGQPHWGRVVEGWCESQLSLQLMHLSVPEYGLTRERKLSV